MSARRGDRRVTALFVCAALLSCRAAPTEPRDGGGAPPTSPAAPSQRPSAIPSPDSFAPDPIGDALLRGRLRSVALAGGARGHAGAFEGQVEGPGGAVAVELRVASLAAPRTYRRPLAFQRLARALGLDLVPRAELRVVGVGELLAAAGGGADARRALELCSVQNDGTVDVLVAVKAAAGLRVVEELGAERSLWARWAASTEPVAGEDGRLMSAYVATRVLDYLAGNAVRRSTLLDERARSLVLVDNDGAFPLHVEANALDPLLHDIRTFQRFPRGLVEGLRKLDRERATAIFSPGAFDTWLLSPRVLVELEERRAGVVSLVEARIGERGEGAVLGP